MTGLPWNSLSVAMWTRQAVLPTPLGEARTAMLPVPSPPWIGLLEDPQRAPFDQLGFDHRASPFLFRRFRRVSCPACPAMSSSATFAGTRPYFRNSMVNSALPWVSERSTME